MPSARRQISWQLIGVVNWIIFEPWGGGEGGTPGNYWWRCAALLSKFQTQKFLFSLPFSIVLHLTR